MASGRIAREPVQALISEVRICPSIPTFWSQSCAGEKQGREGRHRCAAMSARCSARSFNLRYSRGQGVGSAGALLGCRIERYGARSGRFRISRDWNVLGWLIRKAHRQAERILCRAPVARLVYRCSNWCLSDRQSIPARSNPDIGRRSMGHAAVMRFGSFRCQMRCTSSRNRQTAHCDGDP